MVLLLLGFLVNLETERTELHAQKQREGEISQPPESKDRAVDTLAVEAG